MTETTPRASTTSVETYSHGRPPFGLHLAVHVDTRPDVPVVRLGTATNPDDARGVAAEPSEFVTARAVELPPSGVAQLLGALREADPDRTETAPQQTGPHLYLKVPVEVVTEDELSEVDDPLTPEQDARASCLHQAAAVLERLVPAVVDIAKLGAAIDFDVAKLARYIETGAIEPTDADR